MDHDRLFKDLLTNFFLDFLDAFVPNVAEFIDESSIVFLDKELFTDISSGDRHAVDLLVKAKFKGREAFFLIHIENQASAIKDFAERMYLYFAWLYQKHRLPIYPIAILSYDAPQRLEPHRFEMGFPGREVLSFNFDVIQLNRLNWRDFLRKPNPVTAALMTKMRIEPADRPRVMLECLRMMATLKLDPARQAYIRTFMDAYLRLNAEEYGVYNRQIQALVEPERKVVMQITNQWAERAREEGLRVGEEHGIRVGEERGLRVGETSIIARQLARKFGSVSDSIRERITELTQEKRELLADAVLDFTASADVEAWLAANS